jgi:parallel beta-helix repeat protein
VIKRAKLRDRGLSQRSKEQLGKTRRNIMRKTWFQGISLTLGLALTGTSGWAADCGDTTGLGGTRVACACGDTVTTSTKLKNTDPVVSTNLADTCSGDGLAIEVSDVTLDCAKFALRGDNTSASNGVIVSDTEGVTVKRCTISGFETGIGVEYSTEFTIDNNTLQDNSGGVVVESGDVVSSGDFGTIQNNTVQDSDVGIGLIETSSNTVKNNKVSITKVSITFVGIAIVGDNVSQANVVTNNSVEDGVLGIAVFAGAQQNTITNNRAKNNSIGVLVGFGPDGSDNNVVAGNRADQNGVGIAILTNNNLVNANLGSANEGDGLAVVEGTGNSVSNTVFNNDGGHGVCAELGNLNAGGNAGHDNLTPPDVTFAGGCTVF